MEAGAKLHGAIGVAGPRWNLPKLVENNCLALFIHVVEPDIEYIRPRRSNFLAFARAWMYPNSVFIIQIRFHIGTKKLHMD